MTSRGDKLLIEFPQMYVAIDSTDIEAITDNKTVATIPDNDSFIDGVIVHRGETFALANISTFLEAEEGKNKHSKIIILKNENKQIALSVGDYPISFAALDSIDEKKDKEEIESASEEFFFSLGKFKNKTVKGLDWISIYNKSRILLAPRKNNFRVLLVDDEPFFRNTIKNILSGTRYKVVGEAENGEEGIKLAIELKPDLVIMDIMMPVKNGIKATAEITELELPMQVIMCSSTTGGNSIDLAFDAGAKGFIEKPIIKRNFLDTLTEVTS